MKEDKPVELKIDRNIAFLTLNRPHVLNAFNDTSIKILTKHLQHIQQDDSIYAVVLRGNGGHFSAGADIEWMRRTIDYSQDQNEQDALLLAKLLDTFYHLNKPTITLVHGSVFGGAIGLVACSDITIAAFDTTFCFSEVKLGLIPAMISPYVIKAIGTRKAMRYMLTAETFLAKTAYTIGLVHKVVKEENLEKELTKFLTLLHNNGQQAMRSLKKLIRKLTEDPLTPQAQIFYTAKLIAKLRVSTEAQEGLLAFLEKRPPCWKKFEEKF